MFTQAAGEALFELGKVLLKVQIEKSATHEDLAQRSGAAGEKIVFQKIAKFWNQQNWLDRPDGLLIVTTHRVAFLAKVKSVTVTTDFLSFPFEAISNLSATRVMLISPAVRFEVGGKPYVFTLFSGASGVQNAIAQGMTQRGAS